MTAFQLLAIIAGSFLAGLLFTLAFFHYPLVFIPAQGLAFFCLYYLLNRGMPPIFGMMGLIALSLLPLLQGNSEALPRLMVTYLVAGGVAATSVCLLAWWLFPQPAPISSPQIKKPDIEEAKSPAHILALRSTLAVLPLSILFIALQWTSECLTLVYAAIYCMTPQLSSGKTAGINTLVSTLLGGVVAAAFHYLIVAAPVLPFLAALLLLVALLFSAGIFSNWGYAKYMPSAAICFFILVGGSMKAGADFESMFLHRLALILGATLYVVLSISATQRLFPAARSSMSGTPPRLSAGEPR